jgi:hypothetical protein
MNPQVNTAQDRTRSTREPSQVPAGSASEFSQLILTGAVDVPGRRKQHEGPFVPAVVRVGSQLQGEQQRAGRDMEVQERIVAGLALLPAGVDPQGASSPIIGRTSSMDGGSV